MRVWTKQPNGSFHFEYIANELNELQEFVGGYIETLTIKAEPDMDEWAVVICNEDGIYLELPENCEIGGHVLYGNIIICGQKNDEFADAPEWVSKYTIAYNRGSGFLNRSMELFADAMSGEPV